MSDTTDLHGLPAPSAWPPPDGGAPAPPDTPRGGGTSLKERLVRSRGSGNGSRPSGDAPAGPAGLEARSISAWFGDHLVLDRVSLSMRAGEVTALIGPSGCGKSTFLRILNRMHELIPSAALAGEVLLDGVDIYDPARKITDARRSIGMVFQKPNPFPAMSIYDNVVASLRLTGTKARTRRRRTSSSSPASPRRGCGTRCAIACAQPGGVPLRRPAAAAVHRPGPGDPAPRAADGRAVLRPRPHLHPPHRADHRRSWRPRSPS